VFQEVSPGRKDLHLFSNDLAIVHYPVEEADGIRNILLIGEKFRIKNPEPG
jgi:hypothetical protein